MAARGRQRNTEHRRTAFPQVPLILRSSCSSAPPRGSLSGLVPLSTAAQRSNPAAPDPVPEPAACLLFSLFFPLRRIKSMSAPGCVCVGECQ